MRSDGSFHGEHSACARVGRKTFADLVDHIRPLADGGLIDDRDNLQSLCRACHGTKTDSERSRPRRFVICGPPDSGKTSLVGGYRRPGDLVWDLDAVADVIAHEPIHPRRSSTISLLLELRETFLRRVAANPLLSCYVIVSDPGEAAVIAKRLGAELRYLTPPLVE